ncbi:hypothetical protein AZH46_12765 [Corynebacterium striatum]|uniref:hypothetical protein n=1 Tax=Corynebacterium striatum TaxID=43770 RepID=UPI000C1CC231|nr:hypothetical protein [Corynebacterium striatum]MBD0856861.1 hypothetical protein [Corynebacterium striatum]PIS62439.1 hypothetical protein AZH44_11185 [Corynebacterium striatum]PIS66525.1 hypothetical protein AZH46_12765 [Corynebacterium striatum]PXY05070.1 hypothetical protein CKF55_12345 [Corynebacterium striatum]PXY07094.1 hypothetical protein CKF72_11610 [Corynebacterium striatum]
MKRLPQTLTAAVLTGALAFGGAAVAQAQIPAPVEDAPITDMTGDPNAQGIPDPETITVDGVEYFKEGYVYKSRPKFGEEALVLTKEQALAARDKQAEALINEEKGSETPDASGDQKDPEGIPAPATKEDSKGNTWYQSMKDPSVYVNDPALVNVEVTPEMRDAYAKAFPSETPSDPQKPGFDAKKLAWLALPAALIIGGITWYLSQDGKTYVKDEARKNQQPTAEEKAASEQMLNANKDEVMAQGGKLADGAKTTGATRGMAAETGSNTVARGLAGLAVAAMVAAAAFAARRKFFA